LLWKFVVKFQYRLIIIISLFALLSNCGSINVNSLKTYNINEIVNFNKICMVFGDNKMFRVITSNFDLSAPIEIKNPSLNIINDAVKSHNHVFVAYNSGIAVLVAQGKKIQLEQLNDGANLNSIACGVDSCLAVNYFGTMVTYSFSDSYKNWQQFTNASIPLGINKVLYYKDRYLIITNNGQLYSSRSVGKSWDKVELPIASVSLNNIKMIDGVLYILGDSGVLLSSIDGITWVQYDNKMFDQQKLSDIAFGNKKFVVIGAHGAVFIAGPDKVFLKLKNKITVSNLTTIEFFNNKFILVGYGGVLFISNDAKKWHLLPLGADYKLNLVCN
jgi:hypothetical protein